MITRGIKFKKKQREKKRKKKRKIHEYQLAENSNFVKTQIELVCLKFRILSLGILKVE